jgi:outer membrane immunogenic protein
MSAAHRFAVAIAVLVATALPASAQDYGPYGYGSGFDWNGFYAGIYGGGVPIGTTSWNAGVFTGVNVAIDSAVFGVEAQLGGGFGTAIGMDALILGKGGMSFGEAMVYGTAGTGFNGGAFGYAFGAGGEYAFTNSMTARVEALGRGAWGSGPSDVRLAAGLAFHM